MQQYTQRDQLALQIINLAKAEILLENPFLAEVVGRLTEQPAAMEGSLSSPKELEQLLPMVRPWGLTRAPLWQRFACQAASLPSMTCSIAPFIACFCIPLWASP